jgi:hypothetical protein
MTPGETITVTDDDGRQIRLCVYRSGATIADVPLSPSYAALISIRLSEAVVRYLQGIERRERNG